MTEPRLVARSGGTALAVASPPTQTAGPGQETAGASPAGHSTMDALGTILGGTKRR